VWNPRELPNSLLRRTFQAVAESLMTKRARKCATSLAGSASRTEFNISLKSLCTAGASSFGYASNKIKGDCIIQLKGPYDIALNKQPDSSFGIIADFWEGKVESEVGKNFGKLMQLYAVHKAVREARRKGHLTRRSQQHDGSIKLVIAVGV